MPLTNTIKMFKSAQKNKNAIGAFNITNMEQLQSVIDASNETKMPVIVAVSESAINFCSLNLLCAMAKSIKSKTDFALHLDHGKTFEICKKCVDAGFTSVMFDGSFLPYEDNIKQTKKVVEYAHKHNVCVEGELGVLKGVEDNINSNKHFYTSPIEAREFVEKTGVDSLAISIGTSHGAYKFSKEQTINIKLLKEIKKEVPNTPLVLHGASSIDKTIVENFNKSGGKLINAKGVDKQSIQNCIANGICKINTDSDLRIVYTTAIRNALKNKEIFSPRDYLFPAKNELKEFIKQKILEFKN